MAASMRSIKNSGPPIDFHTEYSYHLPPLCFLFQDQNGADPKKEDPRLIVCFSRHQIAIPWPGGNCSTEVMRSVNI